MTFENGGHVKNQDMVLNLTLVNKSGEVSDDTPTPTRFIRNCEEVGLFQDLQNVNPFDETFKKATEAAKAGTLLVPTIPNNDDTLHTPHIFPIESNVNPIITESFEIIVTDEKKTLPDLKTKLIESLKNKVKIVAPVPDTLKVQRNITDENCDSKAKIREMNRAAQLRCRKRKQILQKQMQDDIKQLKRENSRLNLENQHLKHTFYTLKEMILKHKNTNFKSDLLVTQIEDILNAPPTKPPESVLNKAKVDDTATVQAIQPKSAQKPVFIQVLGPVSQLGISVLPNK